MKTFVAVLLLFVLSACTTVQETSSATGKKAYAVNCTLIGWNDCFVKAGNQCGAKGYKILDRSTDAHASMVGGNSWFSGSASNEKTMLIACKK